MREVEQFSPRSGTRSQLIKGQHNIWALVLAAGDGARLASLTTDHRGIAVPKQFCSLNGGKSLLQASLQRARRIVPHRRVCVIVARSHEQYWRSTLWSLPTKNVIVQPRNCGTANGLLLSALRILERDPLARIIFLPADHHVHDERLLTDSVRAAAALLTRDSEGFLLVGIAPEEVDPELGYILPGASMGDGTSRVAQFVEKPPAAVARNLIARGAVWNSFIFAAHATALVAHMRARFPEVVDGMTLALARDLSRSRHARALKEFYERLPTIDFSRSVAQGAELTLRVFTAPACGWTDLGTPRRVANVLQRLWGARRRSPRVSTRRGPALVNLAAEYMRLSIET